MPLMRLLGAFVIGLGVAASESAFSNPMRCARLLGRYLDARTSDDRDNLLAVFAAPNDQSKILQYADALQETGTDRGEAQAAAIRFVLNDPSLAALLDRAQWPRQQRDSVRAHPKGEELIALWKRAGWWISDEAFDHGGIGVLFRQGLPAEILPSGGSGLSRQTVLALVAKFPTVRAVFSGVGDDLRVMAVAAGMGHPGTGYSLAERWRPLDWTMQNGILSWVLEGWNLAAEPRPAIDAALLRHFDSIKAPGVKPLVRWLRGEPARAEDFVGRTGRSLWEVLEGGPAAVSRAWARRLNDFVATLPREDRYAFLLQVARGGNLVLLAPPGTYADLPMLEDLHAAHHEFYHREFLNRAPRDLTEAQWGMAAAMGFRRGRD